jgi:hypothetical protein
VTNALLHNGARCGFIATPGISRSARTAAVLAARSV